MMIEESVSELKWMRRVNEEILKTDAKEIDVNSAWIKHWENVVKSLDVAIDTMRKYQKIEEIVSNYGFDTSWLCLRKIREVIEDGKID